MTDDAVLQVRADQIVAERVAAERMRARFGWSKVAAPSFWNPKVIGEEILGYYGGRTMRNGRFGQYEVIIVHVPVRGALLVSGTEILQLVDTALVVKGHPIRIVWQGLDAISEERAKKRFDLLIAEGPALAEVDLPAVVS